MKEDILISFDIRPTYSSLEDYFWFIVINVHEVGIQVIYGPMLRIERMIKTAFNPQEPWSAILFYDGIVTLTNHIFLELNVSQ